MPTTSSNNEHIEQFAESGRQVATQATRAGADMARHGAETVRQALDSSLNSIVHIFKRVSDQFTQVFGVAGPQAEELARRASHKFRLPNHPGAAIIGDLDNFTQLKVGLKSEGLRTGS